VYSVGVMDRLAVENERLQAEDATLRQRVAELEKRIAELEAALSGAKRQATPFARQKRVDKPKRSGRKIGQGALLLPSQAYAGSEGDEAGTAGELPGVWWRGD
jgi:septal ring factor EnvC (AmiA/AmiB activator)